MRGRRRDPNRSAGGDRAKMIGAHEVPRVTRRSLKRSEGGSDLSFEHLELKPRAARLDFPYAKQTKSRQNYTEEEIAEMWLFVIDRIRDPVTEKIIKPRLRWKPLWTEFVEQSDTTRDVNSLNTHFNRTSKLLHNTNFDLQTKTNLHYALELPIVDKGFLAQLRDVVDVVLDKSKRIVAYRKKRIDGALIGHEEDYWDEVWDEEEISKVGCDVQSPSGVQGRNRMSNLEHGGFEDDDDEDERCSGSI